MRYGRAYGKVYLDYDDMKTPQRTDISPLSFAHLSKLDGKPVWCEIGNDLKMWVLVEVQEESVWLTNSLGGRSEYTCAEDLIEDEIRLFANTPGAEEQMR